MINEVSIRMEAFRLYLAILKDEYEKMTPASEILERARESTLAGSNLISKKICRTLYFSVFLTPIRGIEAKPMRSVAPALV